MSQPEFVLGVTFRDQSLLTCAFTHRSYANENGGAKGEHNERLEFLGDAILDFLSAALLYDRFPGMNEGDLTALRAAIVKGETLARFARGLGLAEHLLVSRGDDRDGGRTRVPSLAGAFEAIVGALYIDQGLNAAREFACRFLAPEIECALERKKRLPIRARGGDDPKTLLQELAQGELRLTPRYRVVSARGPDHAKEFTVEAVIGERVVGRGTGPNKRRAKQEAARKALKRLRK